MDRFLKSSCPEDPNTESSANTILLSLGVSPASSTSVNTRSGPDVFSPRLTDSASSAPRSRMTPIVRAPWLRSN